MSVVSSKRTVRSDSTQVKTCAEAASKNLSITNLFGLKEAHLVDTAGKFLILFRFSFLAEVFGRRLFCFCCFRLRDIAEVTWER